jgi:hypothetical protein
MEIKRFTLEEAHALLPQIRNEILQLQHLKLEFERSYKRLRRLKEEKAGKSPAEGQDPFFELECSLEFMQMEARTLIRSVHMKGAQLKDIDMGLVDFPAMVNGEEALLCWKLGEDRIGYYHGWNEGYNGRKPLDGDGCCNRPPDGNDR